MGKTFAITPEGRDAAGTHGNTDGLPRPCVRGKFLFRGDRKLHVKGVTYGPFAPREDRDDGFQPDTVEADQRCVSDEVEHAFGDPFLHWCLRHGRQVLKRIARITVSHMVTISPMVHWKFA